MRRTRLRNKFIVSKTDAVSIAYNKQRNYCVSLIGKEKKAYYSNLKIRDVKISPKGNYETNVGNDNEPILNYINNFKNHPSIKVIKSRKKGEENFTFNYISYKEVLNETKNLQTATAIQQNDIPTKF